MLPDKCSIKEETRDCFNPPEFVITVVSDNDQFMLGLTCQKHRTLVLSKIKSLQEQKKIPNGTIKFEKLKSVGTDCVRVDSDEFIQLD